MALILKDRVKETSATAGTGTLTLTGAVIGYQTFNSVVATGSKVYYAIQNTAIGFETEWEVGVGTFTATASLSRDTVLSSSNSGSLVNFSADPELQVFITQPAEEAVYLNQATGLVEVGGNGTNTVSFTSINTTNLTANTVTLTAGTISTNAANATDIVNKQYVDGIVSAGVHYHEPVLVESPIALNALYNQPGGAGNGVGATLTNNGANVALVIDGVTLSNTARVLVYQQANAVQNGFYTVTNPGNVSAQWVLTRATDADTYVVASSAGLSEGSTVFVQSGDTGAGEVYTCTTPGTITFGTTDITFAQIGSAQIYSAGTGLNLANTTFSISNTAVTAATYDGDGNTVSITVNAQGQITNAANVAINASSISVGTISNARTTANSANGASTIVARDSNGSFSGNVITGTTGTFTNISGNGIALTDINASNISSGTIANARTTANSSNSASTIVLRDSNGSFAGNVISANFFNGDGSNLSAINASSISSGTLGSGRLSGPYTDVTGVGTVTVGTWNANVISAQYGGTGSANLTADNVILGNGANAVKVVAPGTLGNVLTSNGTSWVSQAGGGGGGGGTSRTITDFTATNGQTTFTVSYTVGLLDVFRNGVKLAAADVTATNGTSFTIAACATGDIIQAIAYTSLNVAATITSDTFSGNGVQTTFIMSVTPANPSSVLVAISGVVQAPSTYSVSTTSLIFSDPPPSGSNNISARYLGIPSAGSGLTLTDDNSTNATRYLISTANTSGSITTANVSSAEFFVNPGTNVLSAPVLNASYGIHMNPATLSTSYTIPANNNAMSAGPVTIANSVTITVSTDANWTIV